MVVGPGGTTRIVAASSPMATARPTSQAAASAGQRCGMTMKRSRRHQPAPSVAAVSSMDLRHAGERWPENQRDDRQGPRAFGRARGRSLCRRARRETRAANRAARLSKRIMAMPSSGPGTAMSSTMTPSRSQGRRPAPRIDQASGTRAGGRRWRRRCRFGPIARALRDIPRATPRHLRRPLTGDQLRTRPASVDWTWTPAL